MKKKFKIKQEKIGILGGTFDPPHYGHLGISKLALQRIGLSNVIWVITKRNPLKKKPSLNVQTRINLLKKMLRKEKKITINFLEKNSKFKNTYHLLNFYKKKYSRKKIYFLIGADNLINLHKWYKWEKITNLAKIVIFSRFGYIKKAFRSKAIKKIDKKDWIYINSKNFNISSSKIRKI